MEPLLPIALERPAPTALSEQIRHWITAAIRDGRLPPGARLPSWRDLAAQLGVARGTVRVAYQRLVDDQLILTYGPAGTFVAEHVPGVPASSPDLEVEPPVLAELGLRIGSAPVPFQGGVPAHDGFPVAVWSRLAARAARSIAERAVYQPDPRGEPELRREIAAHLSIARGLPCAADQIFVTTGYTGALGMVLHALDLANTTALFEDPGYPPARFALAMAGITTIPVPVDDQGLMVEAGIATAPDAALAVVTSGQQAPLGMALSVDRRHRLIDWAAGAGAWIVDDDYLSELQLTGRAAPALASMDSPGRVLHVGTFSKTISPVLRLGFVAVPPALAARFGDIAATLCPAPSPITQTAVAEFLRDGHYLRHLRRMKRLYIERRDAVRTAFERAATVDAMAGLAVVLRLPAGVDDRAVARHAAVAGIAPVALSPWYAEPDPQRSGLLLTVTNVAAQQASTMAAALQGIIATTARG